jgi:UPF0042 nucleotide-binding protein
VAQRRKKSESGRKAQRPLPAPRSLTPQEGHAAATPVPQFVIITGLSGSGKGSALKVFEDMGFYAIDNLPVDLIPTFTELLNHSPEISRAALVVDIREGRALERFPAIFRRLRRQSRGLLIFLEAEDAVLQRRYSETRRPHPLGKTARVRESIEQERKTLLPIRKLADIIVDTSHFNIHELRRAILSRFESTPQEQVPLIAVTSFGFKHGVPTDSDLLFDVRFLPNPHYVPGCRHLTGQDEKVVGYVRSFPQTDEFIARISDLLIYLIPHYAREGKSYLTISFGCTGGRHRSVMIAEAVAANLTAGGCTVKVHHRDMHLDD